MSSVVKFFDHKKLANSNILLVLMFLTLNPLLNAQNVAANDSIISKDSTKTGVELNLNTDIMSRYIWRGTDYGNSPSIEPTLSVSVKNVVVGVWSAIATNSTYKEIDLYAQYTYKKVSLIFTDYYIPLSNGNPASPDNRYFIYDDKKTAHSLEGSLLFKNGDKFPLLLQGSVFFYGNDKRWGYDAKKDSTNSTYYSSYFKVGYTVSFHKNSADLFIGFTPEPDLYGNSLGVVNVGITGYHKIKLSQYYKLPIKTSLIFNPETSQAFVSFGITL